MLFGHLLPAHLVLLHETGALSCGADELHVRAGALGIVQAGAGALETRNVGPRGRVRLQFGCIKPWLHLWARTCELGQAFRWARLAIIAETRAGRKRR